MGRSAASPERAGHRHPAWTAREVRRPAGLAAAFAALTVSTVVSLNASCQVHEAGHALVGTVLGWEVEQIHLCLPTGGRVAYASTAGGAWIDTVESFAGGLTAAAFLVGLYILAFWRPRTPLRGPAWWAAGFGPLLWVGPQLVISVVEGTNPHRGYAEVLGANLPVTLAIIGATMVIGAAVHVWLWRSILRRQGR